MHSEPKTKGQDRLFTFTCPVEVEIEGRPDGAGTEEGLLHEIGVKEARCHLKHRLSEDLRVTLKVFPYHPQRKAVVMLFPAVVVTAGQEPPYETVFRFRGRARIGRISSGRESGKRPATQKGRRALRIAKGREASKPGTPSD